MDFEPFPKIARLNRDITITEKIDGTNAAVLIEEVPQGDPRYGANQTTAGQAPGVYALNECGQGGGCRKFIVQAQSRKRLITPEDDNFGFARWVHENRADLIRLLGPGRHFGEWWGLGVQRGYSLDHKKFSLFNPARYDLIAQLRRASEVELDLAIDVVPVLYRGLFSQAAIDGCLRNLRDGGSKAARGFMRPEGIVVYHEHARQPFKVTIENDEKPKGSTE